jgi:hypothetical protein
MKKILKYLYKKISTEIKNDNVSIEDYHYYISCYSRNLSFLNYQTKLDLLKSRILNFVSEMNIGENRFDFLFSKSALKPTIYNATYSCLLYQLLNETSKTETIFPEECATHFNKYQTPSDGLFRDNIFEGISCENMHWWGPWHLTAHVVNLFALLEIKPQYEFKFLKKYYEREEIKKIFETADWNTAIPHSNDIDNKIMNILIILQYSRDYLNDIKAEYSIEIFKELIAEKININTGMWGKYNLTDPQEISRMVQFAYHLYLPLFYDNFKIEKHKEIIDTVLKTQNFAGGYGVDCFSSSCEDIDSIHLLVKLLSYNYRKDDIYLSLKRALPHILANFNDDGGAVFKRNFPIKFFSNDFAAKKNESQLFATWFRTLSIALIFKVIGNTEEKSKFNFKQVPGYQFL